MKILTIRVMCVFLPAFIYFISMKSLKCLLKFKLDTNVHAYSNRWRSMNAHVYCAFRWAHILKETFIWIKIIMLCDSTDLDKILGFCGQKHDYREQHDSQIGILSLFRNAQYANRWQVWCSFLVYSLHGSISHNLIGHGDKRTSVYFQVNVVGSLRILSTLVSWWRSKIIEAWLVYMVFILEPTQWRKEQSFLLFSAGISTEFWLPAPVWTDTQWLQSENSLTRAGLVSMFPLPRRVLILTFYLLTSYFWQKLCFAKLCDYICKSLAPTYTYLRNCFKQRFPFIPS